jgi:hypothetical protein
VPSQSNEQLALAVSRQPVSAAIQADSQTMQLYMNGIYSDESCGNQVNQAVLIVGYGNENGEDYWIVKNSWGSIWGEGGYIRIAKQQDNSPGVCGIAISASYPTGEQFRQTEISTQILAAVDSNQTPAEAINAEILDQEACAYQVKKPQKCVAPYDKCAPSEDDDEPEKKAYNQDGISNIQDSAIYDLEMLENIEHQDAITDEELQLKHSTNHYVQESVADTMQDFEAQDTRTEDEESEEKDVMYQYRQEPTVDVQDFEEQESRTEEKDSEEKDVIYQYQQDLEVDDIQDFEEQQTITEDEELEEKDVIYQYDQEPVVDDSPDYELVDATEDKELQNRQHHQEDVVNASQQSRYDPKLSSSSSKPSKNLRNSDSKRYIRHVTKEYKDDTPVYYNDYNVYN